MGKARRERVVALTKTRKKLIGREPRQEVLKDLRNAVDNYEYIYLVSTGKMRNAILKKVRGLWRDSKFFFGRLKIAQVALGRDEAEEYAENLRLMAAELKGDVGLLFTNRECEQVVKWCEGFREEGFARGGFVSEREVVIEKGVLEGVEVGMEGNLRGIGLPVGVKRGKVMVEKRFVVCEKGSVLTPENAKILEILGEKMERFEVEVRGFYRKKDGHFEVMGKEEGNDGEDMEEA